MTIEFEHPHWAWAAQRPEADLKECLITGYHQGKPFSSHNYHFFQPHERAARLLDFGCGIGRNFPALRQHAEEVVAFDIPEMIEACRRHGPCGDVVLTSDWGSVREQRFDVVIATLVFQHIDDPGMLGFVLADLASMCRYLYVSGRCWIDGDSHRNTCRTILAEGAFRFVKGTVDEEQACALAYPDDTHLELLFESRQPATHPVAADLFGLAPMHYPRVDTTSSITLTQLFTPNFDHWACKVLDNKKRYCQRHGYDFHYRRGLYPEHADRHPSWHRVPMLLALLDETDGEWIFWSDIDSLIMRQDVRLESLLVDTGDRDLVIPDQGAGLVHGELVDDCLCFGQFFLRNTAWSRQFLRALWRFPEQPAYRRYLVEESWEQEAVNHLYREDLLDFRRRAHVVDNRLFNSFFNTQYREGDFLIHFAGEDARGEGRREALIDEYLARLENGVENDVESGVDPVAAAQEVP